MRDSRGKERGVILPAQPLSISPLGHLVDREWRIPIGRPQFEQGCRFRLERGKRGQKGGLRLERRRRSGSEGGGGEKVEVQVQAMITEDMEDAA